MIANSPTYRLEYSSAFAKTAAAHDVRLAQAGEYVTYCQAYFRADRYFDEAHLAALAATLG